MFQVLHRIAVTAAALVTAAGLFMFILPLLNGGSGAFFLGLMLSLCLGYGTGLWIVYVWKEMK